MYRFYLGGVLLPITPEKVVTKIKNQNKTMILINEGEVNFLRSAGLTDIDFDVIIPAVEYPFAQYADGFKNQKYFLDHFEKLKTGKQPFQFAIARRLPNGNLLFDNDYMVSLEDYTINEGANQGFDLKISISLKTYRSFATKIPKVIGENKIAIENEREKETSPAPTEETSYTVKSGDTLWNIAKKLYGNGSKYVDIYSANRDKIINPNNISAGQILVIPAI